MKLIISSVHSTVVKVKQVDILLLTFFKQNYFINTSFNLRKETRTYFINGELLKFIYFKLRS